MERDPQKTPTDCCKNLSYLGYICIYAHNIYVNPGNWPLKHVYNKNRFAYMERETPTKEIYVLLQKMCRTSIPGQLAVEPCIHEKETCIHGKRPIKETNVCCA